MEFLPVLLLIVIIFLLMNQKSMFNSRITQLEAQLMELRHLLKKSLEAKPTTESTKPAPAASTLATEPAPPPKPAPPLPQQAPPPLPASPNPVSAQPATWDKEPLPQPTPEVKQPVRPAPPVLKAPEPQKSFLERHPDLEKFIGENLVNKIGIAILVLAIAYFVKFAIDNNWVGPAGRVGIGVLCGAILVGIAHRLRNSYKAFSSVMVGGGIAIFYFTITLAYQQFHLFSQTVSFIVLIVITVFAIVLSLLYNKQELAVIALVGGLASPFMVSSGHANYNALFIYLVTLNAGLLIIAYFKLWRVLNASAFGLTVIICAVVLVVLPPTAYTLAFWYFTVLYLMFFAINVANNVKENKTFIAADFSLLLINTSLYFAAGLYLLTAMHHEGLRGLFSASLAVINLVLSFVLFRAKKVDSNILYLLIGITLTFISLTAPIQLHGHYITMFWAAEAVLLYWLYLKSGIKLMKITSLIVWGTMLISLFLDWSNLYSSSLPVYTVIANKGFITTVIAAISSYMLAVLVGRDSDSQLFGLKLTKEAYKYTAFIILFLSGLLEVNHQFVSRYPYTPLNLLYLMLYVPAYVYAFYWASKKVEQVSVSWVVKLALLGGTALVYLLVMPQFFDVQYSILVENKIAASHFVAHWLSALIMAFLFYQIIQEIVRHLASGALKLATWIVAGAIILFLSLELSLASNMLFYSASTSLDRVTTIYIKTGLPVLWGLFSFALMWLGMRNKASTLRIISLTLFSITLIKLLVFDIRDIPPAGKIAAFFCLGVLLLIISFMYQKVKKIIVEDEEAKPKV